MKGVLFILIYIDAWSLNESVYPLFNRESRAGVLDSTCILSCLYFLKTKWIVVFLVLYHRGIWCNLRIKLLCHMII